jgi:hypothetical protein
MMNIYQISGEYLPAIERCFGQKGSVHEIFGALEAEQSEWAQRILKRLRRMSPLSLLVTFRAFQHAQQLNLLQCLHMEHHIALRFFESEDFYEGIEATLIQKREPKWKYPTINDVPQSVVDSFFDLDLALSRAARDAASNESSDALFISEKKNVWLRNTEPHYVVTEIGPSHSTVHNRTSKNVLTSTTTTTTTTTTNNNNNNNNSPPDLVLIPAYPIDPITHQRITDKRPDVGEEEDEVYVQDPLREIEPYIGNLSEINPSKMRAALQKMLEEHPRETQVLENILRGLYTKCEEAFKDLQSNLSLFPQPRQTDPFVQPPNPLNRIRDDERDPPPQPYTYVLREKSTATTTTTTTSSSSSSTSTTTEQSLDPTKSHEQNEQQQ